MILKISEKFMNNELHPQIKWFLYKKWKDVNKPRLCPPKKSPQENDSFSCSLKKHQQQEKKRMPSNSVHLRWLHSNSVPI